MSALAHITHGELIDRAALVAELKRAADNMIGLESLNPEQAAIADLIASGIRAAIVTAQQQQAPLPVPNPCINFDDTTEAYEAGYLAGQRAAR